MCYILDVTTEFSWLLLIPQLPTQPSRHRVAVWRELRSVGAVPAVSGAWVVPDLPSFTERISDVRALAVRGEGSLLVLSVVGHADSDVQALREAFAAVRIDEWKEFIADCGKFEAEIEREIAKEKFTFGELEEEEQSLDRLRRWHRDLQRRNALALPESEVAQECLQGSVEALARFSELVYEANVPAETPQA